MRPDRKTEPQFAGYGSGHPWYYVLGGEVLPPRRIMESALARGYRGCCFRELDDIDAMVEPKRSEALRAMKAKVLGEYRQSLSRYRQLALALHRRRSDSCGDPAAHCEDIHVSISLKHNHLFNDLAHLCELARLLDKQRDLFDL